MGDYLKTIISISLVFTLCRSQNYSIEFTITCSLMGVGGCSQWQTTGKLDPITQACFPGETMVLTTKGYKTMEELEVGDMVYAFNRETRQNQFTQVLAWLHRDVDERFQYVEMASEQSGLRLYASAFHNVAVKDHSQQVKFVFGKDVDNKTLYNSKGNGVTVQKTLRKVLRGVYSPYTDLGNFYITSKDNSEELFLVHCFAHVSRPELYEFVFSLSIKVCSWLGLNEQPKVSEYRHPLSLFYESMFPYIVQKQDYSVGYEQLNLNPNKNSYEQISRAPRSSSASNAAQQRRRKMIQMLTSTMGLLLQIPYMV